MRYFPHLRSAPSANALCWKCELIAPLWKTPRFRITSPPSVPGWSVRPAVRPTTTAAISSFLCSTMNRSMPSHCLADLSASTPDCCFPPPPNRNSPVCWDTSYRTYCSDISHAVRTCNVKDCRYNCWAWLQRFWRRGRTRHRRHRQPKQRWPPLPRLVIRISSTTAVNLKAKPTGLAFKRWSVRVLTRAAWWASSSACFWPIVTTTEKHQAICVPILSPPSALPICRIVWSRWVRRASDRFRIARITALPRQNCG